MLHERNRSSQDLSATKRVEMSRLLGLDLGNARTGIAFADTQSGFVVALDTFSHRTTEDLVLHLRILIREKKIDAMVAGLPRLPSGEEGEQAQSVRAMVQDIERKTGLPIVLIDERYTTICEKGKYKSDVDARAACEILSLYLDQKKGIDI